MRGSLISCCTGGCEGIDLAPYALGRRPDSWENFAEDKRSRTIALADMFRRIPELQPLIEETLGVQPLSFRVGYDTRGPDYAHRAAQVAFDPPRKEASSRPSSESTLSGKYYRSNT